MSRQAFGSVTGSHGKFDRSPFYSVRLSLEQCTLLDELLANAGAAERKTTTITASFHQPDRVRVTEVDPPEYEVRAAAQYVRGDIIRIQGKEGVSCNLDVSARFGVPLLRQQLDLARGRARQFVELRIPSRKRDIVEFVADIDAKLGEIDSVVAGSVAAAGIVLPVEDFSDWET